MLLNTGDAGINLCSVVTLLVVSFSISAVQSIPQNGKNITSAGKSSPCPKRDQRVYLKFRTNGKCYEANTQGPCPASMILFPIPPPGEAGFGFCDCFDAGGETPTEVEFLNSKNFSHCIKEIRGQVYVPERHRCFSVFDQGPCAEGKWLVLNSTNYPVCANISKMCLSPVAGSRQLGATSFTDQESQDALSPTYIFATSTSSKCYQTMTRGYCAENYELRFSRNHFIPQCRYIPPRKSECPETPAVMLRTVRCKPGSRYDHLTNCSKSINPR